MSALLRLVVIGVCIAVASSMIYCPENFCDSVDCATTAGTNAPPCGKNQRVNEKGTWCGCCATCVTQLAEGENCARTLLIGGPPSLIECASGLKCSRATGKCVASA